MKTSIKLAALFIILLPTLVLAAEPDSKEGLTVERVRELNSTMVSGLLSQFYDARLTSACQQQIDNEGNLAIVDKPECSREIRVQREAITDSGLDHRMSGYLERLRSFESVYNLN